MTSGTEGYGSVNGLEMYYAIHGSGKPLVLLHGALSTIATDFGNLLPRLAKDRQVIGVEQQAHGHTADIDRPLSYEQMAEDTVALVRQLGIDKADFFGYSMGGGIALQIALRHSDLVRKFVFAGGASYSLAGLYPEMLAGIAQLQPEHLMGTPWQRAYASTAPRPDDWPTLVTKMRDLDLAWAGWSAESVRSITAPALLVIGDSDVVRPEHAAEMFRLLGGGVEGDTGGLPASQLAVLPGTSHTAVVHRVEWLLSMVTAFLDAPVAG
jgi:pimeloyl-ACP methyl ester carboxylesterase